MMKALNSAFEVVEGRPWWRKQVVAIGLTILLLIPVASDAGAS